MSRYNSPKLSRPKLKASEEEVELLTDSDADIRAPGQEEERDDRTFADPLRRSLGRRPAATPSPLAGSQYVSLQIDAASSPIYVAPPVRDYVEFDEETSQAEAIDSAYRNPSWCCAIAVLSTSRKHSH